MYDLPQNYFIKDIQKLPEEVRFWPHGRNQQPAMFSKILIVQALKMKDLSKQNLDARRWVPFLS